MRIHASLLAAMVASPAAAQIDTGAIVQGQLTRSMADGHAERDRGAQRRP
jgi:hypothetical protein